MICPFAINPYIFFRYTFFLNPTFSNTRIDAILSSIAPASILCSFNSLKQNLQQVEEPLLYSPLHYAPYLK